MVQAQSWVISTKTDKNHEEVETGGPRRRSPPISSSPNRQLITVGFGPEGTQLPKPPSSTILALQQVLAGGQAPVDHDHHGGGSHATTAPSATTSSAPASTTTTHRPPPTTRNLVDDDDQVMKAVVLVGGEGTRLRPLTLSSPKQMLPIVGVPMIERVLGHLAAHGVDEAVLSLGYLPDAFMEAYPDGRVRRHRADLCRGARAARHGGRRPLRRDVRRYRRDLRRRQRRRAHRSRPDRLVAFHRERGAEGTIALHPVADPSAFGVVPTDDEGRVTAFVEKPPRDEAPTNEINAGTYVLEPSVLDRIPEGGRVSIERETFPAMVRDGGLFARSDDRYWLDTGTPAAYLEANFDYLDQKRGPVVAPGRDRPGRRGPVGGRERRGGRRGRSLGRLLRVRGRVGRPGRAQHPRAWDGRLVRRRPWRTRCLMDGCHVAADAKVAGSVMGPRSIVGQRGDVRAVSVLGADAVVSSGTLVDGERVSG